MLREWSRYKERRDLIDRWIGQNARIDAIVKDLREKRDWTRNLLRSDEFGWDELPGIRSCPTAAEESGNPRDLRGIHLIGLDLEGCDGLADSHLDYAVLDGVNLAHASLIGVSARCMKISGGSTLENADFRFSFLNGCAFRDVSMARANFTGADISGAEFQGSNMERCLLADVRLEAEGVFGAVLIRPTRFGGDYQRPHLLDPRSDRSVLRYMAGELRREMYEQNHPPILSVSWHLLSNFGRSPGRLLLWLILIWFSFGLIYSGLPLIPLLEDTPVGSILDWASPSFCYSSTQKEAFATPLEPFYFSAVTFTTLGYGDICPAPGNWKAQVYVSCEALMGYLLLGLLVSLMVQNENEFRD